MRKIFVLLIFGFSIIQGLVVYLTELLGSNSPYQLSEWLINYEAGFIRRGFSGSLYLAFFPSGQKGLYVLAFLLFLITLIPQYVTLIWLEKVGFHWSYCNHLQSRILSFRGMGYRRLRQKRMDCLQCNFIVTFYQAKTFE